MIFVPVDLEAREARIREMGGRLRGALSEPFARWLTRECVAGLDSEEIAEALARVLAGCIDGAAAHIGYCAARADLAELIKCDMANRVSICIASSLMSEECKETVGHG